ncbi:CYFA0S02e01651g1_1 [Cyberlindnera fabianii]|uniref:CYFA0S02e01651g1_1 n=1 Tax=Cyberlindnera fabianii TaxID=36022 RepID=A0A061ALL2_CYBFA|nr:CYFA0S02e01651g1_1 [Cyberlindnera fabianii]
MFKSVTMATRAPTRRRTTFTEATDRSLLKNVLRFKPYAVKSRKRGKVWEVVINSIIEDCKEVRADASMAVMVKSFKYRYHRLRQAWLKKEHMSKPVVDLHQKLDVDTAKYDDNDDDQFKELVSPELNAASDRIPLSHGSSATNSESNINRSVSTFQPTRPVTRALGPAMMAETPSSLSTQQVTPLDYSSYTTDPSPVTTLITPSTSHQHSLTRHASTTSAQCSPQNYLTRTPVSTQLTFDTPTTSGMMITRPDGLQLQKDYIALQRRQVELMEEDMRWKWEFLKVLKEKQIDEATLNLVAGSLSLVPNTGADTALRYDGELVEKGS